MLWKDMIGSEREEVLEFVRDSRVGDEVSWEVECAGEVFLVEDVTDAPSPQRQTILLSPHKLVSMENGLWISIRCY